MYKHQTLEPIKNYSPFLLPFLTFHTTLLMGITLTKVHTCNYPILLSYCCFELESCFELWQVHNKRHSPFQTKFECLSLSYVLLLTHSHPNYSFTSCVFQGNGDMKGKEQTQMIEYKIICMSLQGNYTPCTFSCSYYVQKRIKLLGLFKS